MASDMYTRSFLGKSPFLQRKQSHSANNESLNPTPFLYTLQNPIVQTSTLPNVTLYLNFIPKIILHLNTLPFISEIIVPNYRKRITKNPLCIIVRCKTLKRTLVLHRMTHSILIYYRKSFPFLTNCPWFGKQVVPQ